jgi:type VI secretion system protein ImpA
MTPPLLDLDALTAPIGGSSPAGRPVPFEIRQRLDDARKEVDPSSFAADDPLRPAEAIKADWPLIIKQTQQLLTTTSKDLLVAARLTEAMTRDQGVAGLRDGLGLLRRLIESCWDRVLPVIEEEEDVEARGAAFYWLDDPDRGARFPQTVRMVPLVAEEEKAYAWFDWKRLQSEQDPAARGAFDKAAEATPREDCQNVVDDLAAAFTELDGLAAALNEKMGHLAPGLTGLRQAMGDVQAIAQHVLSRKGPAPAPGAVTGPAVGAAAPDGAAPALPSAPSREQVYRQVAAAAAALRELEPHSPIPYLLDRAVELGRLPFPELMKVLVRDNQVLEAMNRELGIKPAE